MGQITMTPDAYATGWKTGMTNSVPKIQAGIQRLQDNPMAKAAASSEKMLANLTAAVTSGKWANSLNSVDFNTWKTNTSQKVGERMATGATQAAPKMLKFGQWLIPTLNSAKSQIDAMPSATLQDNINRMVAQVNYMAANPYKK